MHERLKLIGLKDDEAKALIILIEHGQATAGEIAKKIHVSRTSLYGYVKTLCELGFVTQSQKNGVKIFSPASREKMDFIFEQKINALTKAKSSLSELFKLAQSDSTTVPKFQIFEGPEEMRNLAKDFLLYQNTETQSYWPIKAMIEVLGEDFFREFNISRIKRNIWVNAIWPEKQKIDMKKYPFMGAGEEFLREVRIAPVHIDFSLGYWIYENKVAFISSKKSNFGFIIENKEFTDMLRSQFNMMWKASRTVKVSKAESKKLFEKI